MSLKKNIILNYLSQIYTTCIGIILVPTYLRFMGGEAYGLIGFFTMLQSWFQLLDIGLTPTMTREAARFRGSAIDASFFRRLFRIMEGLFISIALIGGAIMIGYSSTIASRWLRVQQLSLIEVQHSIVMMAIIISIRWICGLYRSIIFGFEEIAWLAAFNIFIASARFGLIIPIFYLVGSTPTIFFEFQLIMGIIEFIILIWKAYQLLPKFDYELNIFNNIQQYYGVIYFAGSIALTSSLWVLVTQTDKLILSKLLPLKDYGYFSLAVMVSGGIMLVSGPIANSFMPRMAVIAAVNDEVGLIRLYRNASQLATWIAAPTTLVLVFFAKQILLGWTGNEDLAYRTASVLRTYALGNGIVAIGGMSYCLQFVKGDLKLHVLGSGIFALLLVPTLIWTTLHFGLTGPGYAWLGANILMFLFWVPLVHRRFARGLHFQWLFQDILPIVALTSISAAIVQTTIHWPIGRIPTLVRLGFISLFLLIPATLGSSWFRNKIFDFFQRV